MNYLELLNTFWRLVRAGELELKPAAALLYMALLAESNHKGWPAPLFVGTATLMHLTSMGENTLLRARKELAAAGLIEYAPGDGRGNATAYTIKAAKFATFYEKGTGKAAKLEPFEEERTPERSPKKAAKFEDQYKHINRSPVDKSDRQEKPSKIDTFTGDPAERENPAKETETAQGTAAPGNAGNRAILDDNARGGGIPQPDHERPLSANSGKNNSPGGAGPTLAQVEAEQRAKGYKLEAARFYSHFAPDWKTANGEPVRSWRKLYAWCETNGLFDTAPQKTQGPQQLPPRDSTEYEDRLPPECYETQPETDAAGDGERLDLAALEREIIGGGGQQPRNSRYL